MNQLPLFIHSHAHHTTMYQGEKGDSMIVLKTRNGRRICARLEKKEGEKEGEERRQGRWGTRKKRARGWAHEATRNGGKWDEERCFPRDQRTS